MSKRILSLSPKGQVRLHGLHELIHDNSLKASATKRFIKCGFTAESLQRLRAQYECAHDEALLAKVKTFDLSQLFLFVNDTRQQVIAAESSHFDLRPSAYVWDVLSGTQSFVKGVTATHCGKRGPKDAQGNVADAPHEVDLIFVSGLLLKDVDSKDGFEYQASKNKDAYVNQQLIDRLTNVFKTVADQCPANEKRAVILPGIGAGAFAGNIRTKEGAEVIARVKAQLDAAIRSILVNLPQAQANKIAAVVFDSYQGHEGDAKTINGVLYKASSTKAKLPALPDSATKIITEAGGDPQEFDGQVVKVSKIVAWDMLSCEGNEGRPNKEGSFAGSTYNTDDPLMVRDTNVLDCIDNVNQPFSAGNPQVETPQVPSQEDKDKYPISEEDSARHKAWVIYQHAALAKIEAMQPIEETLHSEQDEAEQKYQGALEKYNAAVLVMDEALKTLKGKERTAYLKTVIPCVLVPLVAVTAALTGVGFGANMAVQLFPALSTGLSGVVSGVLLGCAIALVAGVIAGSVLRGQYAKQEAAAKGKVTSSEQEKNSLFLAKNAPMHKYRHAKLGPEEVFQKAHGKFTQAVDAIVKGETPASTDQHTGGASKEGEAPSTPQQ